YARERSLRVDRRSLVVMIALGAGLILGNQISFIYAVRLSNASTVALLFGTMPVFAAIFGRERLGPRHWAAAALSLGGVPFVASGARGGISGALGGILLGLIAPITWAFYSVTLQPYLVRYSGARINAIVSIACCVPFVVIAAPQLADEDWGAIPLSGW